MNQMDGQRTTETEPTTVENINMDVTESEDETMEWDDIPIILLDLETSGLDMECDILQIGAKCGKKTFDIYINPTKLIPRRATHFNGLSNSPDCDFLMYNGEKVASVPLQIAMEKFLQWLSSFERKCCIVAHNLNFDGSRMFVALVRCSLISEFSNVILGFTDSLLVLQTIRGRTGINSIKYLTEEFSICATGAHNAIYDCKILHEILIECNVTAKTLIQYATPFEEKIDIWTRQIETFRIKATLMPLDVGESIRKKIASAGINMSILQSTYSDSGPDGIKILFNDDEKLKRIRDVSFSKIIDSLENM